MKISKIKIKGFRSLKEILWQPGNLNVIIGPNASGKSNLLRFLELISNSAAGRLAELVQHSGGMGALLWDGKEKRINFQLDMVATENDAEEGLQYSVNLPRLGKGATYRIDEELLYFFSRKKLESTLVLERTEKSKKIFTADGLTSMGIESDSLENETVLSKVSDIFDFGRGLVPYQKQLVAWKIYHSIDVGSESVIRQAVVSRSDRVVQPNGKNLISVLHTLYTSDRDFKKDINMAMRAAFGDDFEELLFPPAGGDQRIELRIRWKSLSREQSAAELSDGTLRFLFLLTVLASPDLPPLIAIDEPETGLHPSMLPIIAEFAIDAAQRSQIIFCTHSPSFLDSFATENLLTTVVQIERGKTKLKNLNNELLADWLAEYSLGNLYCSGELEDM